MEPGLTPIPNVTGFGANGTMFAQLFYNGEEQFYCTADSCAQSQDETSGSSSYKCDNLKCTCIPNATFCGAVPITNLTGTINALGGTVSVSCDAPSSDNAATCSFQQATINSVFGSAGLSLNGCTFGECVRQNVIDTATGDTASDTEGGSSSLSGGVIAGLAVVGGLIGLALLFLLWGLVVQRKARRVPRSPLDRTGGASVEWTAVSYFVPNSRSLFARVPRRQKSTDGDFADHKVVLDSVSGQVLPGQMMAILGPSGKLILFK